MLIPLHKQGRTTPAIRRNIETSDDSVSVLAQRYNVPSAAIYKWRSRDSFQDLWNIPHTLETTKTPARESIVSNRGRTLLHPLDDLLAVASKLHNGDAALSGLSRLLRPRTMGYLATPKPKGPAPIHNSF